MTFVATQALNDAMLAGGIDAALDDDATEHAFAVVFEGSTPLVTILFAKPAAAMVDHALLFVQEDVSGDMIPTQGLADGFELYSASGVLLGVGDVSDMAGAGALKVSGTTGTLLYAGARAILGEMKFA